MKMQLIIAVAALGFGTLVGCGGVEDAETGEMQSVTQALCESPPTNDCVDGTVLATPVGKTCTHFTWTYISTCQQKSDPNFCKLWKCSSGGTWSSKTVTGACSTFNSSTTSYCI